MASLQVRDLPPAVHQILKARSVQNGLSLSAYVARELEFIAARPTLEEVEAAIKARGPVELDPPAAQLIAKDRAARS